MRSFRRERRQPRDVSLSDTIGVLARGHRFRIGVLVVASFAGGMVEAASLYLLAQIAFAVTQGRASVDLPSAVGSVSLWNVIIATALLVMVRFLFMVVVVWEQARLYTDVMTEVRDGTVDHFLGASWAAQSGDRDGRLQELLGSFATQAAQQMSALTNLLSASCSATALLVTAMVANALATVVVGAAGVALVLVMRPLRAAAKRRSRRAAHAGLSYGTAVSEVASMAQEIHVFGVERPVSRLLAKLSDDSRRKTQRTQQLSGMIPALYQAAALLVVVAAVAGVYSLGAAHLASLGAVVLIGVRVLSYGNTLQGAYQTLYVNAPYVEAVLEAQSSYALAGVEFGQSRLGPINDVMFDEVSFSYDGRTQALTDVSFLASRGEIIGIVGPSGSGKSTLVQLLLRLRHPTQGSIYVNGCDAQAFTADDWTKRVAFVPQDAHLFRGTVSENVRFYRDQVSREAIEAACRFAHVHAEIMSWPDGYETQVGERGRQLSGGQRQRLTIARALVGDPDVVILDEPTSNLDAGSEQGIRETMRVLSRRALVFVIAHRLSTLDICSRIMVIQQGVLCDFDSPAVLEASSGFYQEALRLSGLR